MPALSKSQRRLFGMVTAFKEGKLKLENLPESLIKKIKSIANKISLETAKDYGKTKETDLPDKIVNEFLNNMNYEFDNDNCDYYVRYSDHIEDDLKRGWSSWNFGSEGITSEDSNEIYDDLKKIQPKGGNFYISGFDIWIDEDSKINVSSKIITIKNGSEIYNIKELYKNYWVLVDDFNTKNGLSAHKLSNKVLNLKDAIKHINNNKYKYDGSGDGETFNSKDSKVIYSKDNLNIIEVAENYNYESVVLTFEEFNEMCNFNEYLLFETKTENVDIEKMLSIILKGGKSDGLTIEDIAKKHNYSLPYLKKALKSGIKIEHEHTIYDKVAEKIALDHLTENPLYYDPKIGLEHFEDEIKKALNK